MTAASSPEDRGHFYVPELDGLRFLAFLSYGLYVFHVASLWLFDSLWWPWRGLLGLGVAVLVASLSYRCLERPFLRLKDRFTHINSAPRGPAVGASSDTTASTRSTAGAR